MPDTTRDASSQGCEGSPRVALLDSVAASAAGNASELGSTLSSSGAAAASETGACRVHTELYTPKLCHL